jgi:hypothetical protein
MCAMYLRNKIPCHDIGNKTSYEIWYDHVTLVRHLMVFGSTCYALIPKDIGKKLVKGVESEYYWHT